MFGHTECPTRSLSNFRFLVIDLFEVKIFISTEDRDLYRYVVT